MKIRVFSLLHPKASQMKTYRTVVPSITSCRSMTSDPTFSTNKVGQYSVLPLLESRFGHFEAIKISTSIQAETCMNRWLQYTKNDVQNHFFLTRRHNQHRRKYKRPIESLQTWKRWPRDPKDNKWLESHRKTIVSLNPWGPLSTQWQ